jgi:SanA protein
MCQWFLGVGECYTYRMFRVSKYLCFAVLVCMAITIWATLWVIMRTNTYIYSTQSTLPARDVALILGASIKQNGELSPVLEERADAAIALYNTRRVGKILVSGDNGTQSYNEVYPVGKYLLAKGVPEADIFLDYAGFDTYSSMYRAKEIFGVRSMTITSQRFHLPRALYIARSLGIDAVGLDTSAPGERYFENSLREVPATLKALFDLVRGRMPQYLGPQFFITGDGSATWIGPRAEMIYFIHDR